MESREKNFTKLIDKPAHKRDCPLTRGEPQY